ncbi:MAG: hypothetical protein NTY69_09075 [Methylococcales bacterium]|nr:hypothetical protein [Methylococcales bacterium]
MFEIIFVLLVIFTAYIVFGQVDENKDQPKATDTKPEALKASATSDATNTGATKPKPAAKVSKAAISNSAATSKADLINTATAIKPKVIKKTIPRATTPSTPKATVKAPEKKGLKNPETSEVATSYSNYRFAKRWIKDALVAEGLLDQVYKNAEITDEIDAKIKTAISQLEALDKYKP